MFDQFTLGIEEEFQIVDPETRELRSHVAEILEEGRMLLGEQVKPEMIQSQIEVGTGVCKNIQEARADITNLRGIIASLAEKNGLKIVAASTHPISRWQDQKIFDDDRYELLVQELQTVARSLLIFGVHVHVGIADRERQIHIMNASRYFLPHVLALSTSSPFWMGHNTGLKSYRSEIFYVDEDQRPSEANGVIDHADTLSAASNARAVKVTGPAGTAAVFQLTM